MIFFLFIHYSHNRYQNNSKQMSFPKLDAWKSGYFHLMCGNRMCVFKGYVSDEQACSLCHNCCLIKKKCPEKDGSRHRRLCDKNIKLLEKSEELDIKIKEIESQIEKTIQFYIDERIKEELIVNKYVNEIFKLFEEYGFFKNIFQLKASFAEKNNIPSEDDFNLTDRIVSNPVYGKACCSYFYNYQNSLHYSVRNTVFSVKELPHIFKELDYIPMDISNIILKYVY